MLSYIALRCVKCRVTSPALFNQWQNRPEHRVQWSSSSTQAPPFVFQRASKFQDSVALIDEHGEHTYGHILQLSGHLARLMQKVLGDVSLQQRVAFLCPNDVSYVITQWATWMAGHIAVPLYPKHPSVELEYFVRDSESAIIVTTSELTQKIKPILSGQQVIVLEDYFFKSSTAKNDNSEDDASRIMKSVINGTDVSNAGIDDHFYSGSDAMIVYTSGTTGPPKVKDVQMKEEFWLELDECVGDFVMNVTVVLIGDLNSRVGNVPVVGIIWKYVVPGRNESGENMTEMCSEREMLIAYSVFKKEGCAHVYIGQSRQQRSSGQVIIGLCCGGQNCDWMSIRCEYTERS
ncbi:Acyl-CoA synthetase member 3, mitochondrial [Halocaridina rubra]|uniref:Acyl-CoA synthetase member 3, mitochondrial n=1 Tax=Halocaridina rubra TaxID=373956 RepID=A0AAN8X2A1_HALRR